MGRLKLSAIECNYPELNIQLKEQFIHGLNDNDRLGEIIRQLTKMQKLLAKMCCAGLKIYRPKELNLPL